MEWKIGQGFDVHAITEGDSIILGGVTIPAPFSLEGYSDADVLLHAITDAVLGAVGGRDIGYHFPPGQEENKDRDSREFLRFAVEFAREKGYSLGNLDATVIAERPKLNPYFEKMIPIIADILQTPEENISLKATTTEKLGFTGRMEGIAALAVVMMKKNQVLP